MTTFTLRSQLCFLPKHTKLTTPSVKANPPFLIPLKTTSHQTRITKQSHTHEAQTLELLPKSQVSWKTDFFGFFPDGNSRTVMVGAVTVGLVLFLIGVDEQKALALGPEGPLMEEFWDNMRRYGLYILTVSTGVAYTILEPIVELLKNPISAILVLTIFGGSIFIVSQVLSAMVGVSDFSYEYGN